MIVDWVFLTLGSWGLSIAIMLVLWLYSLYSKEPAIVDIGWGGSIGLASWWMFSQIQEPNWRQWLLFFFVSLWSLRIVGLLVQRMMKGQKDYRYVRLSEHWKEGLAWKYFIFFQAQALTVAILVVPIALSYTTSLAWTFWDSLGFALFVIGILGEGLADYQMACFRNDPENKTKVCNVGLWYYSRHPNYFFEWIIWMSYAVVAMSHPWGWIGWVSPLLIFTSIFKVTGIPPTEERLLASKGDLYREYQRTTSSFFPFPPRKG